MKPEMRPRTLALEEVQYGGEGTLWATVSMTKMMSNKYNDTFDFYLHNRTVLLLL